VFKSGGFQIGANNCEMNVFQIRNRFQLDDYLAFDQQIQPMLAYKRSTICDRKQFLLLDLQSDVSEFNSKRPFVNGFQKSGPDRLVNLNRTSDYSTC